VPPDPPPFQNRRAIDTPQFQKLEQKTAALAESAVRFDERADHLETDMNRVYQAIGLVVGLIGLGVGGGIWWASVATKGDIRELRKELQELTYGTRTDPGVLAEIRELRRDLDKKQDKPQPQPDQPSKRRTTR